MEYDFVKCIFTCFQSPPWQIAKLHIGICLFGYFVKFTFSICQSHFAKFQSLDYPNQCCQVPITKLPTPCCHFGLTCACVVRFGRFVRILDDQCKWYILLHIGPKLYCCKLYISNPKEETTPYFGMVQSLNILNS
jgi:hypothetical protein